MAVADEGRRGFPRRFVATSARGHAISFQVCEVSSLLPIFSIPSKGGSTSWHGGCVSAIIMTTNIGSAIIQENLEKITDENYFDVLEETKDEVIDVLRK